MARRGLTRATRRGRPGAATATGPFGVADPQWAWIRKDLNRSGGEIGGASCEGFVRWRPEVVVATKQQACPAHAWARSLSRRWQRDAARTSSSPTPKPTTRLMLLTSVVLRLRHASGSDAVLPGTLMLPPKVFSRARVLALVCKVITRHLLHGAEQRTLAKLKKRGGRA